MGRNRACCAPLAKASMHAQETRPDCAPLHGETQPSGPGMTRRCARRGVRALRRPLDLLPQDFPIVQRQHMRSDRRRRGRAEKMRLRKARAGLTCVHRLRQRRFHRRRRLRRPRRRQRGRRRSLRHRADKTGAQQSIQGRSKQGRIQSLQLKLSNRMSPNHPTLAVNSVTSL